MQSVMRFLLAAALVALCAATTPAPTPRPEMYAATLATAPGYMRPSRSTPMPSGAAVVSIYNASYATVAFEVYDVIGAFMAHIHNGTLPGSPGGVVQWAFESVLPGVSGFNPITGSFAGSVSFNPNATGVGMLLQTNRAYFNVHSVAYPNGVIQGNFKLVRSQTHSGRKIK